MTGALATHLWQSTWFALAAGLLAAVFRRNRARVRYGVWFSASCKFFVPFSLLTGLGSHLGRTPAVQRMAMPALSFAVARIAPPFPGTLSYAPSSPQATHWIPAALLGVWACGFAGIALMRLRRWLGIRALVSGSAPLEIRDMAAPRVEVRSTTGLLEPGVVGLWRPVLFLPEGIAERLTPSQVEAVLAHELCHVRRRDNLSAAIHMLAEAVFWFHPLVWWIGARLVEERERACDEGVLGLGGEPRVYAEAILNVCKSYAESPLVCVSGVAGANLRRRIEAIMSNHRGQGLNRWKKFLLAGAGVAALAGPVLIGIGSAPGIRAQSPTAAPPAARTAEVSPAAPVNAAAPPLARPVQPGVERIRAVVQDAVATVSVCKDGDPRLATAAETLRNLPESIALPMVAGYLADERNTVRRAAIYLLAAGPFHSIDPAVGQLEQLCKHTEDLTRGMAAWALGARHIASSRPFLSEMANADTSLYARGAATVALGLLIDDIKPGSETFPEAVKKAVTIISTCADGDPRIANTLRALGELPESATLPMVTAYLADERDTIRRAAILILARGSYGSIDVAVGQLKQLCKHSEDATRGMAALALGTRRVVSSEPILIEMATTDGSPYARRCAAYALGLMGESNALPTLEKVATDPDLYVANNARAAIRMLRPESKQ